MPKSKLIWADIFILIVIMPFIVLWVMVGAGWAFAMLAMITISCILMLRSSRRKNARDYEYEDNYEELYIIEKNRRLLDPSIPVHKTGKW